MMFSWDGLNRRQFPRVNYPCLVVLKKGDSAESGILTHTENVGVGGICVILKQDIKVFSMVDIEIDLLDLKDHIRCQGKVVWNVKRQKDAHNNPLYYDLGIEFDGISQEDHKRLEDVVNRLVKLHKGNVY